MVLKKVYTFDDVALVPKYNNIASRTEPDLKTWMTKKKMIHIPIIPANMDTVICPALANVMIANGVRPIFHRFMSFHEKVKLIDQYKDSCYISFGVKPEDVQEIYKLLEIHPRTVDHGLPCPLSFHGVCLDIAHGHSKRMIDVIKELKDNTHLDIIAGNVCTARAFHDLAIAGADAIKVGIGPGCFVAETLIRTRFGNKPIKDVEVGERVLSHTGKYQKVVGKLKRPTNVLFKITVKGKEILCTEEHKFFVIEKDYKDEEDAILYAEWVEAKKLDLNKHLIVRIK